MSFYDKLGYGFYSNVMKPGAMLAKKLPTGTNILSGLFSDKGGDGPQDPGPGVPGAGVDSTGGPDSQYGGGGYSPNQGTTGTGGTIGGGSQPQGPFGGGEGKSSPSSGKSKTGSAGAGGAGGRAKRGKYK